MCIRDSNCTIVEAKTDLHTIQDVFNHFPNRFLPVVNGLKFIGVIFRDEFFQKHQQGSSSSLTAEDFVSKQIIHFSSTNTIEEAKEIFDIGIYDMVPVTDDDGDLMGVLLRDDVEAAYHTSYNWDWTGTAILQRVNSIFLSIF